MLKMLLLLFVIGSCAGIEVGPLEVKMGSEKKIGLSNLKNEFHGMYVQSPGVNDGSLTVGAQKKIELSSANVQNNHPRMWVQPSEMIDGSLYYGSQKKIGLSSANLKNNPSGMWVQSSEMIDGPHYIGAQKQIGVSISKLNNNRPSMWEDQSDVIDSPLHIDAQKQIELSAVNLNNNLPEVLVEPLEVADGPLYIGGKKRIEISANIKSNPSFGLWVPPPEKNHIPPYINALKEIELTVLNLQDNLLSMSGAIPYLMDPRRDFAEIIKVIYGIAAEIALRCGPFDYEKAYQILINRFAPDGIRKPQMVINDVQLGLTKFNYSTKSLQMLIRSMCKDQSNPRYCDYVIHGIVVSQPERYQAAAKVFFAGYKAAHAFNIRVKELRAISKCHGAHKFIIEKPGELKSVVYEVANLIRNMAPSKRSC